MTSTADASFSQTGVAFWLAVQTGEKRGPGYSLLRGFLAAAAAAYSAGLALYLAAERVGLRRRATVPARVISVGNLSSGGTGKTPFTQMIAEHLLRSGYRPAILSRGHGGQLSRFNAQISSSTGDTPYGADEAGDEALLLARLTPGVPVYVGKNRVKSAELALERAAPDLFILDDGLQYWQLRRDLDIVLVDSREQFSFGPIPRGTLREPKQNLRRAGMVVITRSDALSESDFRRLKDEISRLAPGVPTFRACHEVVGLTPLNRSASTSIDNPRRPLSACGIAQPAAFLSSLQDAGIAASAERFVALADHARFDERELGKLRASAAERNADALIVTGKDAVKFDPEQFGLPVYAADLRVRLYDAAEFWRELRLRAGLPTPAAAIASGTS